MFISLALGYMDKDGELYYVPQRDVVKDAVQFAGGFKALFSSKYFYKQDSYKAGVDGQVAVADFGVLNVEEKNEKGKIIERVQPTVVLYPAVPLKN